MIEQQLTLSDLPVSSSEIYEMMGYGNQTVPEPEIEAETQKLLKQISAIARPSFLFFSINGQLDTMKETLTVEHITFHLGKIITRQLRKSESFVFFVATAGYDFERFQQTLRQENDPLKNYIADTIGSVIAEKTADCMELALEKYIASQEWKHTKRFRAASSFLLISIPSSLCYPPLGFQPDDSYQIGKRNHRNWFRRT